MRVAVLGLGSWGTAIAVRLARRDFAVRAWTRSERHRTLLREEKENRKYLPGLKFPDLLQVEDSLSSALENAEMAVLAVPSHAVRETARAIAGKVPPGVPVVNLAKGLEEGSLERMLQVLATELAAETSAVSLVGPSHAEEVAEDHPTAVVATGHPDAAEAVQQAFSDERFRVYTNDDPVGVELAVALKNVIAIAAGISGGLGYGDNTLGTLITRGLAEMTRLGVALGARPETFFGLAGVGDLVTTCASRHSRNRRVGEAIGRGERLADALDHLGMVAEGVRTAAAARELAVRTGTDMPIVTEVHAVLFANKDPRAAIRDLMTREPKAEHGTGGDRE